MHFYNSDQEFTGIYEILGNRDSKRIARKKIFFKVTDFNSNASKC